MLMGTNAISFTFYSTLLMEENNGAHEKVKNKVLLTYKTKMKLCCVVDNF